MAETVTPEYQLKAVLLFKLTKFTAWPQTENRPYEICVYGKSPFGAMLDRLEQRSGDGSVKVRYPLKVNADLNSCNILFISGAASSHLRSILLAVSYSPVLTISDIKSFANVGGMIELTNQGSHVRFRINLSATKRAQIQIASPLLELATIVSED
ncbi:MAG: YfiR family protein [Pontibacterium sp.]